MNHKTVTGYNITLDQALKQGGFYGPTGLWNSLVKIDGLVLRARVETLVIKKDLQQVYMHITNFAKKKYRIPGGSCEKDVPNYIQAMNECNEEARIKVKPSLINTGVYYIKRYKNPDKWDGIRKELSWVGTYTEVYVGEYDGPFTGDVDDRDKDDAMYKYGKFYPISEVYDILSDKHKEVIDDIFPVIKRSEIKEGTDMIYSDDNKSVHYYPYYTPREMAELGVHNESKNKYSDIQDDAIEWYHEYTDTLYNPDSENWLKELQERYDEYMLNPTRETQQLVLNLGWNLFVVPTLENVLMASKRTKEKLRLERERNNDVIITEEMIFTKKDIVLNIDDFDSGKSNILFITGLSGSGKTTMSSELCEQYSATKLSLDYFQNYHSIQNDPRFANIKASRKNDPMLIWIDKYMKLNPEIKKQSHMFSNIDLISFKDYFIPFFKWLISELKKDDDRYIVEGLHIVLYIPYKDIKKYPLICINTSATKSLVRHWQRDDWTIKDIVQNGYDDILQFKRWNDMYTDFKKSIDESVIVEAAHPYEFGKSQNLYFISGISMDDELLVPRIPDNYMTRNSFEDNITPRVCFSATIDGALMGLSQNIKGKKFYVHVPEDGQRLTIIKPAVASVPDQLITHEHWVMEKVNLKCIGQIEITGDGDNEYEYTYKKYKYTKKHAVEIHGVKEYKAKLYDWKWRWIWKDDTDLTQENASLLEGFLKSDKDIYYNKDKFDSGEINLCFITGHSGSGKSTMARSMQSAKVEHYELDDLNQNYKFTDDNLKEYGDLIYSFFKGPGKKYRYYSYEDMQNCTNPLDDSGDEFDKCVNRDFVKYAMKYANSHKNTKFVIEGIWLYFFFKPEELKDYAVYIKGTSRVLSAFRAAKRDSKDANSKTKRFIYSIKGTINTIKSKYSIEGEGLINTYRKYYENLQKVNESYIEESSMPEEVPNDIRELLRRLNSYDYGYIKNGKKIKGMKNFFEDYKSLTISEFEKYQIGVCWDYVHYEAYWFAKNHYKYETFYIQVQDEDNDCPSHTYLVFYLPNSSKVYYFESSWGKYQGIEVFDNINKLHNTIKERHIESARSKCDPKTYFRNRYDAKSSRWEHLSCGDYMVKVSNGKVKVNESYVEESSNIKVYHLSQTNLDGKTIQPTVPSNYMTKNGYEDGKTKRVCFVTSIDGCLRGLSLKCEGMKLFVHIPDGNYNIYKPSNKEVPDASITGEVWIKKAVNMKCIGQIYVIGDKGEDGIPYKYGNKTAELYDWEWKWIWKNNNASLAQENTSLLESKKSEYTYSDLKTEKDIEGFQQCMMDVFGEEDDTSDKDIKKNMKAIRFNNKIIGYIGFSYYTIDGKNYLGIGNFMIIPQYQNHGHGTKIIADIIEKNRNKYDEIYCYVNKNNKKAIKFYKNIGHVNTSNLTKYGYYVSLYNGTISESSLLEMKRSELDDSEFGLPKLRKYPMPDKDHVLSAIRFFNYVSPENEKELARNIKKKMKQYNVSSDHVGDKNRLKKYLTEDMDIVMDLLESLQFANFEHTRPALVFDLGSVLVDSKIPFKETLYKSKLIPDDIVEELDAYIGNTYWNNKDKLEYYSEDEFYKYMIDRAPEYLKSYIPAALKLQDSDLRLLDYSKTLIKKLKEKGYKLYYISNWSKWSKDKLTRSGFFDFLKDFDGGIFSGDVGHMKPDNAIFQYFFNKYKEIAPTGCIFFDDRHDNISAAMNIGMYGILFNKLYTVEWIYDNLINGSEE